MEVFDCQLVRFPDRHFRMWGKIYFGTTSSNWYARARPLPSPTLSPSVLKIICLQSLEIELILQQNSWRSVTFKGRKGIFPSPGTEYSSLKIEQCVFGVFFFSSFASIAGVQLQTQRARFTSSARLQRIPRVTQGASTGLKRLVKSK